MKLTIDRRKWWRGQGSINSTLLSTTEPNEGKMCCLGFLSLACGYDEKDIRNLRTIECLVEKLANDSRDPKDWEQASKRLPEKFRPDLEIDSCPDIDAPIEERFAGNAPEVIVEIKAVASDFATDCYLLNDDSINREHFDIDEYNALSSAEEKEEYEENLREKLLTEVFAKAGVEVEFIG